METHGPHLAPHRFSVALYSPQIAPNTGNIARLCVATGTSLHLIRPMGFVLSDQSLRRSAMDYWPRLHLTIHDDGDAFLAATDMSRTWLFTSKATRPYWDATFRDGDCLLFGSETTGLPSHWTAAHPHRGLRLHQAPNERCLNLSTAAGIGLYEALRQLRSHSRQETRL